MVRVIFQAKVHTSLDCGGWIEVPHLYMQHCVVEDFKAHPGWRRAISSGELDEMLEELANRLFGSAKRLNLDAVPGGVSVDVFESFAIVTINLMQYEWLFEKNN